MEDIRNRLNIDAPRARGSYISAAPMEEIFDTGEWVLEVKEDGERLTMEIGEERSILVGRNRKDFLKGVEAAGKFMIKEEYVNPTLYNTTHKGLSGTVLDGELTEIFKQNGEYTKGTADRQKIGVFLGYIVWGVLFYRGKDVRMLIERDRRAITERVVRGLNNPKIRLVEQMPATRENLQMLFDRGLEGAIAKHLYRPIPTQQRTNTWWWKLKNDMTVDAFIIGVTEATSGGSGLTGQKANKNGKAASLTMGMLDDEGNVVEVAKVKHLPDELVKQAFKHFDEYENRVMEITVSGWSGEFFRWPRFKKWRDDKTKNDCLVTEQIKE